MRLIVFDSFLTGTFCSAVASYKTDKTNRTALNVFFGQLPPAPQSKKSGLYLRELFFHLGCLSLKAYISGLELAIL